MGALDKEYVQALAAGQKFQVEFKEGSEAAKLSGEYRAVEIKPGRGRGGTLNVIAVDMAGNPMPDVPVEDLRTGVVIADRCFGTSAWPMVRKFSIEGRLVYDSKGSIGKPQPANKPVTSVASSPAAKVHREKNYTKTRPKASIDSIDSSGFVAKSTPDATSFSEKGAFVAKREQLTNARSYAMAAQPKKVYECLRPILETTNKGGKTLLLRFSAVPLTNEINGDYSVISFQETTGVNNQPRLVINLQSLDIPNKQLEFETDRTDIHIKRIEQITASTAGR